MPAAPMPSNESERLAALMALRILYTERSVDFDIFPALASRVFNAPMAAVSFVGGQTQWFKASVGMDLRETPRSESFCAHAILDPTRPLCVSDATQDARFADNPLVTGSFNLRFYAGAPILGPDGSAVGALCVLDRAPRQIDQSSLEQLQYLALGVGSTLKLHATTQELRTLAITDPLTGINNRVGFDLRLAEALTRHRPLPSAAGVGLLFLDLDGFKTINDLFGHAGGDLALQEVAQRLRTCTRPDDILCRFGGDEFCILIENVRDASELAALAARIHQALDETFVVDGQTVPLRISIGVSRYPQDATQAELLVRKADVALYQAKQAGRGATKFADAEGGDAMGPRAAGRMGLEGMLRDALHPPGREPFAVAVQPIFAGRSGHLTGFEALARWPDASGDVMMPGEFIPVAEATGLIVQLDRWVLDQACRLASEWPAHLQISSNVSAANFFAGDLVGDVAAALTRHQLAPYRLKLEVTESVLLRDPARVTGIICALRGLGVQVVLDDFGAGFASLAYLRDYPLDGLKIDRSFIVDIETNPQSRAFMRAIVDMVRALGIQATAEGVESDGQMLLLRDAVDFIQGNLLGRPMAPACALTLIQRRNLTERPGAPGLRLVHERKQDAEPIPLSV